MSPRDSLNNTAAGDILKHDLSYFFVLTAIAFLYDQHSSNLFQEWWCDGQFVLYFRKCLQQYLQNSSLIYIIHSVEMVLYFKVLENLFPSIWDTLYVTVGHVISCQHLLKQYPLLFWRHQTISTFETLLFVSRQQDGHISILKNPKKCNLREVDSFLFSFSSAGM